MKLKLSSEIEKKASRIRGQHLYGIKTITDIRDILYANRVKMGRKNPSNGNSREKKLTIQMKEIKQRTATTYNERHIRRQMRKQQ